MSRRKKRQAAYRSAQNPGTGYVFNFKKTFNGWDLYGCSFCACVARKRNINQEECPKIPTIRVKDDQFLQDPESIYHVCADETIDRSWNKIILGHYYKFAISSDNKLMNLFCCFQ
jgi:hypothetical protein